MLLRDLGEDALIRRIRDRFASKNAIVGIGDDAAILDFPPGHSIVFCSDLLVEGTHFLRDLHPPDSVGYKAVAVNVSDIGAMGGTPMYFTISLAAPGDLAAAWLDAFYAGVERACRDFDVVLAGGDTARAEAIFVDIAMVGRVAAGKAVLRSGARQGDKIYVTGTLGGSAQGLSILKAGIQAGQTEAAAVKRHLYPQPRHRVGAAAVDKAHAMIDVSDGLSSDLAHMVSASQVSARIYKDWIPVAGGLTEGAAAAQALHGGEEYELLIAAPDLPQVIEGVPLTCIGEIVEMAGEPRVWLVDGGVASVLPPLGWDHYSNKTG